MPIISNIFLFYTLYLFLYVGFGYLMLLKASIVIRFLFFLPNMSNSNFNII